jgi:hypothetical protein
MLSKARSRVVPGGTNDFYNRLLAAGKPGKVARAAAMHKLLTILNAMLKHHTRWSPLCLTVA